MNNVLRAQKIYIELSDMTTDLGKKLAEFEVNLPTDPEGEPILPVHGESGYRFRPENVDLFFKRIDKAQRQARRALVKFKHEQEPEDRDLIEISAHCIFLRGGSMDNNILARIRAEEDIPADDDNDREQVVADPVVPVIALGGEEDDTANLEAAANVSSAGVHNNSPNGSIESGTTSVAGTFIRRRARLIDDINALRINPVGQPDTLKARASQLSDDLAKLEVQQIILKYGSDPNFLDSFGDNPDDLLLWMEEAERIISELEFKYLEQVNVRNSCTKTGFQKMKYPSFFGDFLDYYEFKKRWAQEVSPEQKPDHYEGNALRDQVPES